MLVSLNCPTQNYDWGKKGKTSLVGQLYHHQTNVTLKDEVPFAELWMGTHPNGPAKIMESEKSLSDYLTELDENILGIESYKNELPFLLKVLSVNQALSIQAHPNKTLAKELFEKFPKIYKDPNHKPELACALTDFEAFCGFQTFESISKNLTNVPEFSALVGEETSLKFQSNPSKTTLKEVFSNCMLSDEKEVQKQLSVLLERISDSKDFLDQLVVRLNQQYPGDVGCFVRIILC
jgi:mannose-6-phosphate isomerase